MNPWEKGLQSGVQMCIMPGLPTHLLQELNAGTVSIALDLRVDMHPDVN